MTWWRFDSKDYAVGDPLFIEDGYSNRSITEYTVTRITPTGQIVATIRRADGSNLEVRVSASGRIVGAGDWSSRRVVGQKQAEETRRASRERAAWMKVRQRAEAVDKAARQQDAEALRAAMADLTIAASGMSAFGQDPQGLEAKPASPAREAGDAQ